MREDEPRIEELKEECTNCGKCFPIHKIIRDYFIDICEECEQKIFKS